MPPLLVDQLLVVSAITVNIATTVPGLEEKLVLSTE
jgi:hypothetical protein